MVNEAKFAIWIKPAASTTVRVSSSAFRQYFYEGRRK